MTPTPADGRNANERSSYFPLWRVAAKAERVNDRAVSATNSGGRLGSLRASRLRQGGERANRLHGEVILLTPTPGPR